MRRGLLGLVFAMAVGPAAYAQSTPKPAGTTSASSGHSARASVTVEGCVMKEVDVPNTQAAREREGTG